MLPPWLEFPCYAGGDIMWRMGAGEDYIQAFSSRYRALSAQERKWYRQDFPVPALWSGYYEKFD